MKFLKILLFYVLIFLLCGCAKQPELDPKNPTAIVIWHYYNSTQKTVFDDMIAEFNQTLGAKKGIVVKAYTQSSPNDLAEALEASAQKKVGAEPMPDVFSAYADTAAQIDGICGLAPMDDYFSEQELEQYLPEYIEEGRIGIDNKLKILPIAKSTEILMINNTDWLKFKATINVNENDLLTWEGLAEVSKKYYEYTDAQTPTPNDGKPFFCRDALANYIVIGSMQLGHEIFVQEDKGGHAELDEDTFRRLWDNYYIPYIKGYYEKTGRFATDDAKLGNVIALVGASSGAAFYPKEVYKTDDWVYPVELKVLPLPNFAQESPMAVQQGAGMAVTKSDRLHEQAGMEFLKWFTQQERNLEFAVQSAYLPVTKTASTPEAIKSFAAENGNVLSDDVEQAISVAAKQTQEYKLYTSKPIYNGFEIRRYLEASLNEIANNDRQAIKAALDFDATLEQYLTDEHFKAWFDEVQKGVYDLMERK